MKTPRVWQSPYLVLEHVAMNARPYPTDLLEGCETGLVLFAAAFLGHNDAIHFAEAGLETTCVDLDHERLTEMAQLYPREWTFRAGDAWAFADHAYAEGRKFDAVSVDTFTGDAMDRSLSSLELWTSIANRLVTVTITSYATTGGGLEVDGWTADLFERAEGVYWLVLTPREPAA